MSKDRWIVTDHAVDQFLARVGPELAGRWPVVHAWLSAHARHASPLPERTWRGQRQWFLSCAGFAARDAVLVTKTDPDGTTVVVTCGWFEHDAPDGPPSDPVPCT